MKFKRLLLGVGLSAIMIVSSLMVTFAASDSGWAEATIASVNLYGYVDYDEFLTCGKLYYNASISGTDAGNVAETENKVYVQPATNKKTYDIIYLHKGQKSISDSKIVSIKASSGKLIMKCYDEVKTLYATD